MNGVARGHFKWHWSLIYILRSMRNYFAHCESLQNFKANAEVDQRIELNSNIFLACEMRRVWAPTVRTEWTHTHIEHHCWIIPQLVGWMGSGFAVWNHLDSVSFVWVNGQKHHVRMHVTLTHSFYVCAPLFVDMDMWWWAEVAAIQLKQT